MSGQHHPLFFSTVESNEEFHFIKIPLQEFINSNLNEDELYRVLFLQKSPITNSSISSSLSPHSAKAPVNPGDVCEVTIEDIGSEGDGIAKVGLGYIIFVPKTDIGHKVKIKINTVAKKYAFAEVVEHLH
tara:strand:- start:18119 stop:18508 length:390 start_codon:yes stop_codon:yes gene_type:complete